MVRPFSPQRPSSSPKGLGLSRRVRDTWAGIAGVGGGGGGAPATEWLLGYADGRVFRGELDGSSWTQVDNCPDTQFNSLTWDPVQSRYLGLSDLGRIFVSPDGTDWTQVASGFYEGGNFSIVQMQLAYVDYFPALGVFLAAKANLEPMWSEDGENWNDVASWASGGHTAPASDGEIVQLFGAGTPHLSRSTDGKSWTAHSAHSFNADRVGSWGNGLWAISSRNSGKLYTSEDGINWSDGSADMTGSSTYDMAVAPSGRVFVVGNNGIRQTDNLGDSFTTPYSGSRVEKIVEAGLGSDLFIAAGAGRRVFLTEDEGDNWTLLNGSGGLPAVSTSGADSIFAVTPNTTRWP